jgi:hypothetical protein
VIANPPLSSGAFHVMFIAVEETAFAKIFVGAAGGPGSDEDLGVADASFEGLLVPIEFMADTLNVY